MELDDYIKNVIIAGNEGSKLLAAICAPTLKNSTYAEVIQEGMNGIAVHKIPANHIGVVHSAGGDPNQKDIGKYAKTMVNRLLNQAKNMDVEPVCFTDVIDARIADKSMLEMIAKTLVEGANEAKISIPNGELAILGDLMNCDANISGTMLSIIPRVEAQWRFPGRRTIEYKSTNYALFDPEGKPVYMNSDGVGTKTIFYVQGKKLKLAVRDSIAMKLDDTIKIGANAKVVSDVLETNCLSESQVRQICNYARQTGKEIGVTTIMQHEQVGDRLRGYKPEAPAYNISGSAVSVIDLEKLRNPPTPKAGDDLVVIQGFLRSNGISKKRAIVAEVGKSWCTEHKVDDWVDTPEGKVFLDYLTRPSIIFYPVFKTLMEKGLASSVYHMSGGAFNDKLARPLAKHGLHAQISDLYKPDWRELALIGLSGMNIRDAYAQWPLGNEGFFTTTRAEEAIRFVNSQGLEAKVTGRIGGTVTLTAYNGETVHFTGKEG
ncbi:MAG: AIR synthase related protein [Candidatus Woesearchaeota archaeon]